MSYQTHGFRDDLNCLKFAAQLMRGQLLQDFVATLALFLIAILAITEGYQLTSLAATLGIGVVNTLTLSQLYRAFRETQAQNREQYTDDVPPEERENYR